MLDKSSVFALAEGLYFLDKCSPLNFNFLDFPLVAWSYPNSSYDFETKTQFLHKFCIIL